MCNCVNNSIKSPSAQAWSHISVTHHTHGECYLNVFCLERRDFLLHGGEPSGFLGTGASLELTGGSVALVNSARNELCN